MTPKQDPEKMSKLGFIKIYFCSIKNPVKMKKKKKLQTGRKHLQTKNPIKPRNSQNSAVKEPNNLTGKWMKDINRLFTK